MFKCGDRVRVRDEDSEEWIVGAYIAYAGSNTTYCHRVLLDEDVCATQFYRQCELIESALVPKFKIGDKVKHCWGNDDHTITNVKVMYNIDEMSVCWSGTDLTLVEETLEEKVERLEKRIKELEDK